MSSLKNKLNEYIKEHSLNPTSFSRKADISPGIITNIMATENANPTIDTALKIAKIMNCSLDELFDKNYLAGSKIIIPELLQSICDN
jgi:DNA-binding XRE family transcriptional regulator